MSTHQTPQLPGRNSGPFFFKDINMNTFVTHNTDASIRNNANGTCLQGYVDVSYAELVDLFGQPTESDGYKVDAEWCVQFADGTFATIYNYKNGKNYCGAEGLAVEQIGNWHVGGKTKQSVDQVQIAIDLHREVVEAEKADKPANAAHKAYQDAGEERESILESIKAHKGEQYKNAVLAGVSAIKIAELHSVLLSMLSDHGMPKVVRKALKDALGTCIAHMLAASAKNAGVAGDDDSAVNELMEWAHKINNVEHSAAKKIVSFIEKEGE